jgi:methylase of polypeptide subunit release factors
VDPAGSQPVDREVVLSEPREAVFAPPGDPLYFYREMLDRSVSFLAPAGTLVFEVGVDQHADVEVLARDRGWRLAEKRLDLQGIERVLGFERA